jgi:transposase-like protein
MTKEVQKITCNFCESSYKVLYNYEETQGQPRFCSFCGEECFDEEGVDLEDDDNE